MSGDDDTPQIVSEVQCFDCFMAINIFKTDPNDKGISNTSETYMYSMNAVCQSQVYLINQW